MKDRVKCRKGLPCSFTVRFEAGIGAQYTEAKFQVRDEFGESSTLRLEATQGDGITITPGTPGVVEISIGATKTELMEELSAERVMAAELRLYDPNNPDDRMGAPIPFVFLPEVIDD